MFHATLLVGPVGVKSPRPLSSKTAIYADLPLIVFAISFLQNDITWASGILYLFSSILLLYIHSGRHLSFFQCPYGILYDVFLHLL